MSAERTLAAVQRRPVPRSFWRSRIEERAAPLSAHEYLIDEANLRGFWGAFRLETPDRPADAALSLEDIVVGLLAPQAPADARAFKLVLRILQSGRCDPRVLLLRARREGAAPALFWPLELVPEGEANDAVRDLRRAFPGPPRGYRPLDYRYDPRRLIRRPATAEDLWRKPPS